VTAQIPLVISWFVTLVAWAGTWTVIAAGVGLCALGRRWVLALRIVASAAAAALACVGVAAALGTDRAYAPPLLAATFATAVPAIRTLAAHLRIWWWGLVLAGSLATVFTEHLVPLGALGAVGLGILAGAALGLLFGTAGGGLGERDVASFLRQLDVDVTDITDAREPTWGVARFSARGCDGELLDIDVYDRDVPQGQFLARLWRYMWVRRSTLDLRLHRAERVEHAIGQMLWARDRGVGAPTLVAAGRIPASDEVVLVSKRPPGRLLSDMAADELDDEVLAAGWSELERLHDVQIVLDAIRPDTLAVDGSAIAFCEFSRAEAMASVDARHRDDAALLVALARVAGPARAVASAEAALGADRLAALLPLIQPQALPKGPEGRATTAMRNELKALRDEGASQLGIEPVEPAPLVRARIANVLMVLATFFGLWLLIGKLLGAGEVRSVLSGADWGWIVAVLLVTQATSITEAVSMSGSVTVSMPIGPLTLLRFATTFTGMIGGTVGATATIGRFFSRRGLAPPVAMSSGVIYSVAGFIVQIVLTILLFATSSAEFHLQSEGSSGSGPRILQLLLYAVVILGVVAAVVFAVPKIRRLLMSRVRPQAAAAWQNLREVANRPDKLLRLFGGAAVTQLMMAMGLGFALRAVGTSASFSGIFIVCTFTALIGGMAPVPGGIGVMEASYISGLTLLGVQQDLAVGAVLIYRAATTYLPPIWGWGALFWLRRQAAL
jgi:uncharacterized membrane protein YbhN (UPF0104 family)